MKTLTKNKNSKYLVNIGYGMAFYVDSKNDVNDIINMYGVRSVAYMEVNKEGSK